MALVMGAMGGLYYWGPKITGYMLNETDRQDPVLVPLHRHPGLHAPDVHAWACAACRDASRSIPCTPAVEVPQRLGLHRWARCSIGISTVAFVVNVAYSWKKYPAGDNPWDAHTLEWFTTSPPPHHNFYRLPQIRSERPTWDYNHPGTRGWHGTTAHDSALSAVALETRDSALACMRNEAKILFGLGSFFGHDVPRLLVWSEENAGSVMMFAGMLLCFLPGSYYFWWSRRMKTPRRRRPQGHAGRGRGRHRHVSRARRSGPSRSAWALSSSCSRWSSACGS